MWVKILATKPQRDGWFTKAAVKGVSFSDFARHAMDGVTLRCRPQLRRVNPALLRQLARLWNNLISSRVGSTAINNMRIALRSYLTSCRSSVN